MIHLFVTVLQTAMRFSSYKKIHLYKQRLVSNSLSLDGHTLLLLKFLQQEPEVATSTYDLQLRGCRIQHPKRII